MTGALEYPSHGHLGPGTQASALPRSRLLFPGRRGAMSQPLQDDPEAPMDRGTQAAGCSVYRHNESAPSQGLICLTAAGEATGATERRGSPAWSGVGCPGGFFGCRRRRSHLLDPPKKRCHRTAPRWHLRGGFRPACPRQSAGHGPAGVSRAQRRSGRLRGGCRHRCVRSDD